MSGFINNILSRHTDTVASIIPRLPGKFEPVNFPAGNAKENFSVVTESSQPFNVIQGITETGFENKKAANINSSQSIPPVNSGNSNDQNIQPVNNNNTVFSKRSNTGQTSIIKNIIPVDKDADENTDGENISKVQRSVFNELKSVNQFNSFVENFDDQELTGKILMNKQPGTSNIKDDIGNEQDSQIRKNVIKPASAKRNNALEDAKLLQAALIKPSIQNLNAGANHNASPLLREQTMTSVIKVSIGRIEVRAVTSAAPVKVNRPVLQKPRLSLDDYLKNRNGAEK